MKKATLMDRLRYIFDNTMSRGPVALIGWLALIAAVVILSVTLFVWSMGLAVDANPIEQMWAYIMHALGDFDPMNESPWTFRLATLIVTLTGIFVMSTLIGVMTAGIEEKLDQLRKGRSMVVEADHTVILGWSEQVFSIISELLVANENQPRSCIVVLGGRDKVEMEDDIRDKVGAMGHTRIVCRSGSPIEVADLEIVSLHTAKSIIVLGPEGEAPDSNVIKTILAITNNPDRRPEPYHIVAEFQNPAHMDVAHMVGGDELELVLTGGLIARITAQTCRQSGLSVVYSELMDFAGDEIYFQEEPALVGKTFGEALLAYEDSTVMGLCPKGGTPKLNPPMDTIIQPGDQVVAISEDDDTVVLSGMADAGIDGEMICIAQPVEVVPEHVLVMGWNWRASYIIDELANYVASGSTVTVAADFADGEAEAAWRCAETVGTGQTGLTVTVQQADTTDRIFLDGLPFDTFDHVILLSYSDALDAQQADARTLITLLHLRDIAERNGYSFSIVSEMMDLRNRRLAEVTRPDDFIVSDRLVSLVLSQISENKYLGAVFTDLFDPDGSEIYLKPASDYVRPGRAVNFYTVVEAARRRGEVALGYRRYVDVGDAARDYGVVVNPDKSDAITFAEQDKIVVLAES
jgi:voltage-gated potassium channel Kch